MISTRNLFGDAINDFANTDIDSNKKTALREIINKDLIARELVFHKQKRAIEKDIRKLNRLAKLKAEQYRELAEISEAYDDPCGI